MAILLVFLLMILLGLQMQISRINKELGGIDGSLKRIADQLQARK